MKVWMVHRESGQYSDWTYEVKGIFSSYTKAREYLSSINIPVGRMECDDCWESTILYGLRADMYEHLDVATLHTTDGKMFTYGVAGSDLPCEGMGWPDNSDCGLAFHITEYELDKVDQ